MRCDVPCPLAILPRQRSLAARLINGGGQTRRNWGQCGARVYPEMLQAVRQGGDTCRGAGAVGQCGAAYRHGAATGCTCLSCADPRGRLSVLLRSTRQQYHQQIARVLRRGFLMSARPNQNCWHTPLYAGGPGASSRYWQRQASAPTLAYVEAITHLTRGLSYSSSCRRLSSASGRSSTYDFSAALGDQGPEPRGGTVYTRGRALCERGGAAAFPCAVGTWTVYQARGEYQTMRVLGKQLSAWPGACTTRVSCSRPTMSCGPACSSKARSPPPGPTWNMDCGSTSRSGTAPIPRSTVGTTLECVAA